MKPLVSVIIPVYNVEKYLRQCLDSVINQTYKNLEIICINDCTTDSSDKILEEYAKKDPRIIIKNNSQNLGLGLSRNEGIKIAKGDFVHCLDSDDWLELNAYEILVNYFRKDTDAIRFTYLSHNEITHKIEHINYPYTNLLYKNINIYDNPECFKLWSPSAWIKIYRRDFLIKNNLFYNDYRCLEDIEYAMRAALAAKNIIFIKEALLNYRAMRKGSLLTKRTSFVNNIIQDTIWANKISKNLPINTQTVILNYIYEMLIMNSVDAYYLKKMSFKEVKSAFIKYINKDIFRENDYFDAKQAYKLYQRVLSSDSFNFFMSYNTRRFIKEHFPEFTKQYFKIKKRLIKC